MNNDKTIEKEQDKNDTPKIEPSNPIDTPEKVPGSNDEKIDQDFPGYPHYPAKEDMLNAANSSARVDVDVENLTRAHKVPAENLKEQNFSNTNVDKVLDMDDEELDLSINRGTEADVTKEDLLILGPKDGDLDMGEDEEIFGNNEGRLDVTGEDLDIPGAELDDENEAIGEEDEENNYYSLGGDNHENLEEDNKQ